VVTLHLLRPSADALGWEPEAGKMAHGAPPLVRDRGAPYVPRMAFENLLLLKDSSSIAAAAYDERTQTLRITFKSEHPHHDGGTYDYSNVPPEVVAELLEAESLGRFVNWKIKPYYGYRQVN